MSTNDFPDSAPPEILPSLDALSEISGLDLLDDTNPANSSSSLPTCSLICGAAGVGKTFQVRQRIVTHPNPSSIVLAASTGVAATNMGEGVTTIHTLLKFFDYNSIQDAYLTGRLQRTLAELAKDGVEEIVCDEGSMLPGEILDLIYRANLEVANWRHPSGGKCSPLRLTIIADFCQLAPVKASYCFESECWPEFAKNITRLTKIWRQSNLEFLAALHHLRRGEGAAAGEILRSIGVRFHPSIDDGFDGATLRTKNDEVERYNQLRLGQLPGKAFAMKSERWGTPDIFKARSVMDGIAGGGGGFDKQPGDWKDIPFRLPMKIGARVMIRNNDTVGWEYVNGSMGWLRGLVNRKVYPEDGGGGEGPGAAGDRTFMVIELDNGKEVEIGRITRDVTRRSLPDEWKEKGKTAGSREEAIREGRPYRKSIRGGRETRWCFGEVTYFPVALAWATSIHRSQGLSLDKVQIDMRNHFFSAPSMGYVSLSRCRTPEGLRLVGRVEDLAKVRIDEKVRGWL